MTFKTAGDRRYQYKNEYEDFDSLVVVDEERVESVRCRK